MGRYAIERFLFRLGSSTYRDRFAIKGATLFTLWTGDTHRPSKDLDLLGWGSSAIREVEETIQVICKVEGNDGILFDGESVEGTRIKEEAEYEGVRAKFHAVLAGARIPMRVDIGFCDAVYPEPEFASFPVLLPMEAPVIRAYPREAAIAAKLNAMVVLDIRNSRMKDFYDVWFMANTWTFEMATLRDGSGVCPSRSKSRSHMKAIFLCGLVIGWGYLAPLAGAQPGPVSFPLSGDWSGVSEVQGTVDHLVLHMSTTPEGKMTALLDHIDLNISGVPASSGSFDGSRLILRFSYWKPNSNGDYERRVASFEATVSASGAEMTGVWTQEGSWPLTFKRLTWQAKIPKPARPTIFDGDWAGVEHETTELEVHLFFHIHNTEDGLMVLLDCPDERFKGALASKVTYDLDSRQIWITLGQSIFTGKISADGTALDTFMTEPHFHFVIHFDRLTPKRTKPN